MMRYGIVIEKAENNYSAYVPDLPGCVATGQTIAEVEQEIKASINFHLDGLREEGWPIPEATTLCEYVEAG
ncbi:MAG: type II toxin-antitoxin system HicB family antitoxin [Nodularia sp. CChRGM 3473]